MPSTCAAFQLQLFSVACPDLELVLYLQTASKPAAAGGFTGGAGTSADEGATAGMDPVQKDAHRIFNTHEAHNSDNGVSLDQVSLGICHTANLN